MTKNETTLMQVDINTVENLNLDQMWDMLIQNNNINPTADDQELMNWVEQNPNATIANFKEKNITNVGAVALAKGCPDLVEINLSMTQVGDFGVIAIAKGCPNLEMIFLDENQPVQPI